MKRIVVAVISVILALLAVMPMALAQGQGGAPQDVYYTLDLPIPEAPDARCEFPVRLAVSGKGKTIDLPGDRFISTSPGLTATLTNLKNPENQETFVITGAVRQTILENGDSVWEVTGRNLLGDPEAGFVVAVGNFSFIFDKEGNLIQPLSGEGQLIDVCEALE